MNIDMEWVRKESQRRANQASAIDDKVRKLLIDECDALDGDAEDKLMMAMMVAVGMANAVLSGFLKSAKDHPDTGKSAAIAINQYAATTMGPTLLALHKLAKGAVQ